MNKIKIRLANESDANELSKLNDEFNGVLISADKIIESLETSTELIVVALLDDTIVGFACAQAYSSFCYDTFQGEVTEMYVSKSYRRFGVASSMIQFLEGDLRRRGVKDVRIVTGKENKAALGAYMSQGYIEEDYVILQKKL